MTTKIKSLEKVTHLLAKYEDDIIFGARLLELEQRLISIESSITVVGQFSVGKSALLNALLGEEVLSMRRIEATKVLTKIKYTEKNEDKKIRLQYKNGEFDSIPIEQLDELAKYTTFYGDSITDEIESVELYWPVSFLNKYLTLIDTPGSNSLTKNAFKITEKVIQETAAVIYLFNGQKGMDKTDYELLTHLLKRQKHIFIVATHIDTLTNEEWKQVEKNVEYHLNDHFKDNNYSIYPVSSTLALKGKIQKDTNALRESNIKNLELALQSFMETGAYETTSLQAIMYDLEELQEEILIEESVENEREKLEEKFRKQRYERLVAITRNSFNEIEHYGLSTLRERQATIQDYSVTSLEGLNHLHKHYKMKFNKTFQKFSQNNVDIIFAPEEIKRNFQQLEETFNKYYENWAKEIAQLNKHVIEKHEEQTVADDESFIKLMSQINTEVCVDWKRFEKRIQEIKVNQPLLQFSNEDLHSRIEEHEEFRLKAQQVTKEKKGRIEDIQREKKKSTKKMRNIGKDFEMEKEILGKAPAVKVESRTSGVWLWKKTYEVENDNELKEWQAKQEAIMKNYLALKKEIQIVIQDKERQYREQQEELEGLKDQIEQQNEELEAELVDILLDSIGRNNTYVTEQVHDYINIVTEKWQLQMETYRSWQEQHVSNLLKAFRDFIKEVEEEEIKRIKVI